MYKRSIKSGGIHDVLFYPRLENLGYPPTPSLPHYLWGRDGVGVKINLR